MIAAWLLSIFMNTYNFMFMLRKGFTLSGGEFIILATILKLVVLVLMPVAIFGLWYLKKWGLILGYVLSVTIFITSAMAFDIFSVIAWAIVLYLLAESRNAFE